MFWKVAEKVVIATLAIVTSLTVGGTITNQLSIIYTMTLIALGLIAIGGIMLLGLALNFLANWLDRLSEKQMNVFLAVWVVGWFSIGSFGMLLFESPIPHVVDFLAGILLAASIPFIRVWPGIVEEFRAKSKSKRADELHTAIERSRGDF